MKTHHAAVRVDAETGIKEEVAFFGDRAPYLFGTAHLPAGEAKAAVIVCGSVHAELIKAYRKEVLLGRRLAASGIAVQRYHYRGAGNSEGHGDELNLDAMIETVAEARAALARHVDVERIGYLGTRMGAFPATAAACETTGAPLVLWSPIQDSDAFMREVFRSHYIAALKGEEKPEPTEKMIERVKTEGEVELLGYRFTDTFYNSLEGRRLSDYAPKGSPVMLVPFGPANFDALTEAWTAVGADVTPYLGSAQEAWWLAGDPTEAEDGQERTDTLVNGTADWLIEQLIP